MDSLVSLLLDPRHNRRIFVFYLIFFQNAILCLLKNQARNVPKSTHFALSEWRKICVISAREKFVFLVFQKNFLEQEVTFEARPEGDDFQSDTV